MCDATCLTGVKGETVGYICFRLQVSPDPAGRSFSLPPSLPPSPLQALRQTFLQMGSLPLLNVSAS